MADQLKLREQYRPDAISLGQYIRGIDSIRKSSSSSEDFFDDIVIFFAKKFPNNTEKQIALQGWVSDVMRFIQKRGELLIRENFIRSDEGTVLFHEEFISALIRAKLLEKPDSNGSFLNELSILKALGLK